MENKLEYLKPSELHFESLEGGLLELNFKGEHIGRIAVLRMFPFEYEEEYLCIRRENYTREDKEKEVGILRRLSDLCKEQAELVRSELARRYFIPEIIEVHDVKEEFGHTIWNVTTTSGKREFTVTDMNTNVLNLGKGRIMLTDVYSNRYYIPDIEKADDKTVKIIEIWI